MSATTSKRSLEQVRRGRDPKSRAPETPRSEAGFTLVEALVALGVLTVVLAGILTLFNMNNRLAKAQINVAEMQQSLRAAQAGMVRRARMAGRGGLPVAVSTGDPSTSKLLPKGAAVSVEKVEIENKKLGTSDATTVVNGTDILTLRGVFDTPIYQVSPAEDGQVPSSGTGSVTIRDKSPTGVPQDLAPLISASKENRPEAVILVSSGSDLVYGIVKLTGIVDKGNAVQLSFERDEAYDQLSPNGTYPTSLTSVSAVGLLEEHRYYIRDTDPGPRLARARFYPGTEDAYAGDSSNLHIDVADNILDLQVALGIDRMGANDRIEDGEVSETIDASNDDWLFNDAGDDTRVTTWQDEPLYYLRITTLARTGTIDPDYLSPPIQAIEDHIYQEPEIPTDQSERIERRYRRRMIRTVVDMRNLS